MKIRSLYSSIQEQLSEKWTVLRYVYIIIFTLIAVFSLIITSRLVSALADEERQKMEIWAGAMSQLISADNETEDVSFLIGIISKNTSIPVIMLDKDNKLYDFRNIRIPEKNPEKFIRKKVEEFQLRNEPITINLSSGDIQTIYYDNSIYISMLERYPYIQLFIIILYIITAYWALNGTFRSTQDKVWVGLSKETAHQLGTPISSLMAWLEILKENYPEDVFVPEMEKDVERLEVIAARFSKIGSDPNVEPVDLKKVVETAVAYMKKRLSDKIEIHFFFPEKSTLVRLNVPLFEWVIENLCKNAVDSMENAAGKIDIYLSEKDKYYKIQVKDTGKGIPKSKFKTVFNPGYTTKKRGWGLGLSLVKRIVEKYHRGKIYISYSEINKGTTFTILLPQEWK